MINFVLFGTGRIGSLHAKNLAENKEANLLYVYDINEKVSNEVANQYNSQVVSSPEEALKDEKVSAVLIASSTATHVDLIIQSAAAGKHILCEKPIDLSIEKVNECKKQIANFNKSIQIGFNRRYDASHAAAKQSLTDGELGNLEKIIITSRDPAPPWADYLKVSGGIFRDMSIHDFDLSRFVLGDDPIVEVFAIGSVMFDSNCRDLDDFDTTMVIMKSQSGVLVHINNSRRAAYGYDQRLEIFGSEGMVISDNQTPISTKKFTNKSTFSQVPIYNFFLERFGQAYKDELDDFIDCIKNNKKINVTFEDGRAALILANAANESFKTGKLVKVKYN